jgi:hypothetical protein
MASPARDARLKVLETKPNAHVVERGRGFLRMFDPDSGNFVLQTQVGNTGWHIDGTETEVDTALEAIAEEGFDHRMVLADYNVHLRNQFNAGNIIRYKDPVSGEWVIFDPQSINWINQDTSREQIAIKQTVSASIDDDTATYSNAYGTGRHFEYQCQTGRLRKLLILDAPLPEPTFLTGTIWFELEFTITNSAGVELWIDGVQWNRGTDRIQTANRIEFRDIATGEQVFWYLDFPRAWDSAIESNSTIGAFELRRQGGLYFITMRLPKTWVDAATYPVYIDPTVNPQVTASADDAFNDEGGTADLTGNDLFIGSGSSGNEPQRAAGVRFQVDIPNAASITTAYFKFYPTYTGAGTFSIDINGDDVDSAGAWATGSALEAQITKTTATVSFTCDLTYSLAFSRLHSSGADEIKTIVQELVDRAGWAANQYMRFALMGQSGVGGYNAKPFYSYDGSTSNAPKIYVEYSTASATLEQEGFRFRNDDGSESAATWKAAQDTDVDLISESKFRLRTLINATGDPASSQFRIEYSKIHKLIDHLSSGDLGSPTIILNPGSAGAWDDILWMAYVGNLIKVGSTFYLYYTGAKWNPTPAEGEFRAIGVATGSALTSLSKYGSNPIVQYSTTGFTEPEEGASRPTIYFDDRTGIWHMWYAASRYTTPENVDVDIRYRNSTDGFTWSNDTLVYQVSGDEYVPIACFYFNNQWNVYIVGPLSAGAGNLRLLSGSTPTSLSMSLVDGGSWRGSGTLIYLGVNKWGLYLTSNGQNVDVREIDGTAPGTLGSSIEVFTPGTNYFGINAEISNNIWNMIQIDGTQGADDGKVVLRTANVTRTTTENAAWKVVGSS